MKENKKIGVLIPDGVGVRNFLFGDLIEHFWRKGAEVFIFHFLPNEIEQMLPEKYSGKVNLVKLTENREGFSERLYRQAKLLGQLYGRMKEDNSQVVFDLQFRHKPKRLKLRVFNKVVHFVARRNKSFTALKELEKKHAKAVSKNALFQHYAELLKSYNIDVLFCTHQRASKAVPVVEAAKKIGIKTAAFIYSWDNLPKGRMAVMPDYYLVWSTFMKNQLQMYYPELDHNCVVVSGTPQFEPYFNPEKVESKDAFFRKMNLDISRPLICYSGDDITTSPFDEYYLRDVAEALRSFPENERPQLLFRRCPVDFSGRFDWVLADYPEIINSPPLWRSLGGDWTAILPTPEDLSLLVNVTHHSDLVINVASTMCFDFALLGKPGLFVYYSQPYTKKNEPVYPLRRGYDFPHHKVVHELQPVHWLNSKEEIVDKITYILKNPSEKYAERQQWVDQMVDGDPKTASERIAEILLNI